MMRKEMEKWEKEEKEREKEREKEYQELLKQQKKRSCLANQAKAKAILGYLDANEDHKVGKGVSKE